MRALTMDEVESVSAGKSQQPVEAAQQTIGLVDGGGIGGGGIDLSKISNIVVSGYAPNPYNVLDGRFGEIFYGPSPWLFADMPLVRGGGGNVDDGQSWVETGFSGEYLVSDAEVTALMAYWKPTNGPSPTEEVQVTGHQSTDTFSVAAYAQTCGAWFMGRGIGQPYDYKSIETMDVDAHSDGVDRTFIFLHESDPRTHLPATHGYLIGGHVTVASGYDLAVHSLYDLKRLALPEDLQKKLEPYIGKNNDGSNNTAAFTSLADHPLTITMREANLINSASVGVMISDVARLYGKITGRDFEVLPDAVKTVLVDVTYLEGPAYGHSNPGVDPHFYDAVKAFDPKTGNISGLVAALANWQDNGSYSAGHKDRWNEDAAYLVKNLWTGN